MSAQLTMDIMLLAISILTASVAGGNILFLVILLTKKDGLYFLEKAALAYGIGLAAISLEMLLVHLFNLRFDLKLLVAPWVVIVTANGVLYAARGKYIVNTSVPEYNKSSRREKSLLTQRRDDATKGLL